MKNFKKVFGLTCLVLSAFTFTTKMDAATNCDVNSLDNLKTEIAKETDPSAKCDTITIKSAFSITSGETITLNGEQLIIDNVKLTIDDGASLVIGGYFPGEQPTYPQKRNVAFISANSKIEVKGSLTLNGDTRVSELAGLEGANGKLTISGANANVKIDGYTRAGIGNFEELTVENGATLTLTNNGNGSHSAKVTLDNGHVVANNNSDAGFGGQSITATNGSTIEANNNGLLGVLFQGESSVESGSTVTATGNGTSTKYAQERRHDIAVGGSLEIKGGNTKVTAGDIASFCDYKNTCYADTTIVSVSENGTLTVDETPSEGGDAITVKNTSGTYENGDTTSLATTINSTVYIEDGEELVLENGTTIGENARFIGYNGAKLVNHTTGDIKLEIISDTKESYVTVKSGDEYVVKTINVKLNGITYVLIAGKTLAGLNIDLTQYTGVDGFIRFKTVGTTVRTINEDTVLNSDIEIVSEVKETEVKPPVESEDVFETEPLPENPNTNDNMIYYLVIGMVSVLSLFVGRLVYVKND